MRVKTGFVRHRKHHKLLSRTKGFRMTRSRLPKIAHEADLHAGQYAFVGRKKRKRDFRRLWITRIKAGLQIYDLPYSRFINLLKINKIVLDRKILASIALDDPDAFAQIVQKVKPSSRS